MVRGKFKLDMFKATVHIYICEYAECTTNQANKIIKKFKEAPVTFPIDGLVFSPDQDRNVNYLFLSIDNLTYNTICHELFHMTDNILEQYSLVEKEDGKETSANISGYLGEKIFSFLNKKQIKINN